VPHNLVVRGESHQPPECWDDGDLELFHLPVHVLVVDAESMIRALSGYEAPGSGYQPSVRLSERGS